MLAIGCEAAGGMKLLVDGGMDEKAAGKACVKVRKDGGTVDIDGDYTETLARIQSNPQGVGVFGLSFYENNTDKLNVATMNGITPSVETISTGEYPVSRPLFFYVKKDHVGVIPRAERVCRVLHQRKDDRPGRPARRLRPRAASGRSARSAPGRSQRGQGPQHVMLTALSG
ncbi:MAG: hypothetical protein A49_13980 [Methyloceanibacter sp.]|nr:MAG: hypothetical protein A49_13980 [Methyloceanibacter sp.]